MSSGGRIRKEIEVSHYWYDDLYAEHKCFSCFEPALSPAHEDCPMLAPIIAAGGLVLMRLGPNYGPLVYRYLSAVAPKVQAFAEYMPNRIRVMFPTWEMWFCDKTATIFVRTQSEEGAQAMLATLKELYPQAISRAGATSPAQLMEEARQVFGVAVTRWSR